LGRKLRPQELELRFLKFPLYALGGKPRTSQLYLKSAINPQIDIQLSRNENDKLASMLRASGWDMPPLRGQPIRGQQVQLPPWHGVAIQHNGNHTRPKDTGRCCTPCTQNGGQHSTCSKDRKAVWTVHLQNSWPPDPRMRTDFLSSQAQV
jgi:hypothetical protein